MYSLFVLGDKLFKLIENLPWQVFRQRMRRKYSDWNQLWRSITSFAGHTSPSKHADTLIGWSRPEKIFQNENYFVSDLSNMTISEHANINILIMAIKPIQVLNSASASPGHEPSGELWSYLYLFYYLLFLFISPFIIFCVWRGRRGVDCAAGLVVLVGLCRTL